MADFVPVHPSLFAPRVLWRLVAIFLPAALLAGGVVLALYSQKLASDHTLHEQAADHWVNSYTDVIQRQLKSVESHLLYLANQEALRAFLSGRAERRAELQKDYVLFCQTQGLYDQIRYLDDKGQERIRVNYNTGHPASVPDRDLQAKVDRYYFPDAMLLNKDKIFMSPFDLNMEHNTIERPLKPTIRFATPVFDKEGAKCGILILNYLGAALINAEVAAGFEGSVWLLNPRGYYLRGPSTQDEWGFMLDHERSFASQFPDEWPRVSGPVRGQFRTSRGLFTFRTLGRDGRLLAPGSGTDATRRGGASDPWLVVLAHIPPDKLEDQANQALYGQLLLCAVLLLFVLILAWYLAYAWVLRRDQELVLADSAARLRILSSRLLTAQEDERRKVSRDLHDELGQVVTSMTLDLQRAAQAHAGDRKDELIARALTGAGRLLDHIHEISTRLRPTLLDDLGLKDAVQSLLSDFEKRTGISTRADLHFEPVPLPPAVSENVYRILQEALTNVSKHARAAEVFVTLRVADGVVNLAVRDAGAGLDPGTMDGTRLGILGMRERAELLDGALVVKSAPGRGTEVQVRIPIPIGTGER